MDLLILGLGNPGAAYVHTRHNVGFDLVDRIQRIRGLKWKKRFLKPYYFARETSKENTLFLVKPFTYMNRSGDILQDAVKRSGLSLDNLLVVCDNLDLPPGRLRLKRNSGTVGHKGINSIRTAIDSFDSEKTFLILYVGIGRPGGNATREKIIEYVLSRPNQSEQDVYRNALETGAKGVLNLLDETPQQVMNELNRKE